MKNYYKILEIDELSEFNSIKKNYYKLAMKYHPDKNKTNKKLNGEKFKEIVEAYEVLSNPKKKKRYDISLKNKEQFNFKLSDNIYRFSKLFFCEDNINKFQKIRTRLNNNMKNIGIDVDFELLLNNFLNNIRNNKYNDIFYEYKNFKKFYDYEIVNKTNDDLKKDYFNFPNSFTPFENNYNFKTKNENKYNNKSDFKSKSKIVVRTVKKRNIKNKFINININVDLSSIYNKVIKYVNINVNKPCINCLNENKNRKKLNKKNKSNKKCKICNEKLFYITNKKFTIDTSVDKICYLNEHYISENEGYYDIIFTILQKKHDFLEKKNRYDLQMTKEITLYEYYYGGEIKLDYLDNMIHIIKFEPFNNNIVNNIEQYDNMGLIFIDENKKYKNDKSIINNCNINDRGDLFINYKLKLPIYNTEKLIKNENLIKQIL